MITRTAFERLCALCVAFGQLPWGILALSSHTAVLMSRAFNAAGHYLTARDIK